MELQICSKEISIQLKELGFNWITRHGYITTYYHKRTGAILYQGRTGRCKSEDLIFIPTQALVCKWFRDVHDIIILIEGWEECLTFTIKIIFNKKDNFYINSYNRLNNKDYDAYEQAEEAGILKAIEILKARINE